MSWEETQLRQSPAGLLFASTCSRRGTSSDGIPAPLSSSSSSVTPLPSQVPEVPPEMNPSGLPSTSRTGLTQPLFRPRSLETDLIDGNCISVPASARDDEVEVFVETDAGDGDHPTASATSPEFFVKTALEIYSGEEVYKMSAPTRGICLIINNIQFQNEEFHREGSERDGEGLRTVFQQLGFSVHYLKDLTAQEMIETFEDYSTMRDHRAYDCFVAIILTHGWKQNLLHGVDGNLVSLEDDLIVRFNNGNCPQLKRKPKLFFVQACRGDQRDAGVSLQNVADAAGFKTGAETQALEVRLPSWSDTVIIFSTIDGYVSLRNINTGSWFGDALIRTLCENACDKELHPLLTKVNTQLMQREGSSMLKQSLEIVYRGWSRAFYFNPGYYES